MFLSIYDILWYNGTGDLHKKTRQERENYLTQVQGLLNGKGIKNILVIPWTVANNPDDLVNAVQKYRYLPGSEGAMVKAMDSIYSLTGNTKKWVKFKNTADIDALVIGRHQVKGATAWNYYCAIVDSQGDLVPIGITYTTQIKVDMGHILRVSFTNLDRYKDTKADTVWYNWYNPRAIESREDKSSPNDTFRADVIVQATHGVVGDKPAPKNMLDAIAAYENKKPIDLEGQDPFLQLPYQPKTKFVLQAHVRGRSVHLDNRRQIDNDYLVGMTLFLPIGLSRIPKDESDARKLVEDEVIPKVKEILKTPEKKLRETQKAVQPVDWLKVNWEMKPGEVGATTNDSGFFVIIDQGDMEWLAQKQDFHEYWFHGDKGILNGKYVDRLITGTPEKGPIIEVGMPIDESFESFQEGLTGDDKADNALIWEFFYTTNPPYVICPRSIDHHYSTPFGRSQLPEKVQAKVPPQYQFWNVKDDNARFSMRRELVSAVKEKKANLSVIGKPVQFKLQHQTWRGPIVVRIGPSDERYRLIMKFKENDYEGFEMDSDMRQGSVNAQLVKYGIDVWNAIGAVKPGTDANPTKDTPSTMEVSAKGLAKVLVWSPDFKRVLLRAPGLKGTWQAVRGGGENLWRFSRFELMHATLSIESMKLDPNTDSMMISGPVLLDTIAKGTHYEQEALKKIILDPEYANKKLAYINWSHKRDEWNKVGILTKVYWNKEDEKVWFDGIITDKTTISILAERYNSGKKLNVSAEVNWDRNTSGGMTDLVITGMALTDNPAVPEAGIAKVCDNKNCVVIPTEKIEKGIPRVDQKIDGKVVAVRV